MIDLHCHSYESDGTDAPEQMIPLALEAGLGALAITDHDTLAGYDKALPVAEAAGLDLVCGIELSTKHLGKTVHLLGYFLDGHPAQEFRGWLEDMQASRRDRNRRLAVRLRELGLDITLEEVERKGRSLTGRPHFAQVLVEKGYVRSSDEAFREYLDESAKGYVQRREPAIEEAIRQIRDGGGISSLAHPVRVSRNPETIAAVLAETREMGLDAVEALHSDHTSGDTSLYLELAKRFDLHVTGGSDYHGKQKPKLRLGCANVPYSYLRDLRG